MIVVASRWPSLGHVVTFVVAARTAGVDDVASLELVPLALLVLLAMGVPANVAGWGPREGVAAWAFAAAGLGAAQGVATAVVYGVMVLVASLPGAVVLLLAPVAARPGAGGASMPERPYTLLSCGMSIDGYLDARHRRAAAAVQRRRPRPGRRRSAPACDAILVGAATVRHDNPRLLVRAEPGARDAGGARACRRRRSR